MRIGAEVFGTLGHSQMLRMVSSSYYPPFVQTRLQTSNEGVANYGA